MYNKVGTSDENETKNSRINLLQRIRHVYMWDYFIQTVICILTMLSIAAIITGIINLNKTEKVCPWNTKLPLFLLFYGIFSLIFWFLYYANVIFVTRGVEWWNNRRLSGCILAVFFSFLAAIIGLLIWDVYFLPDSKFFTITKYFNATMLKTTELSSPSFNATVEKDCIESVRVVSWIFFWLALAVVITIAIYGLLGGQ